MKTKGILCLCLLAMAVCVIDAPPVRAEDPPADVIPRPRDPGTGGVGAETQPPRSGEALDDVQLRILKQLDPEEENSEAVQDLGIPEGFQADQGQAEQDQGKKVNLWEEDRPGPEEKGSDVGPSRVDKAGRPERERAGEGKKQGADSVPDRVPSTEERGPGLPESGDLEEETAPWSDEPLKSSP